MAWIINFSLTVSLGMVFAYQCAYKWEFAAAVHATVIRREIGRESGQLPSTQPAFVPPSN